MDILDKKDPKSLKKALTRRRNKKLFIKHMQLEALERENERAHDEEEEKKKSYERSYSKSDKGKSKDTEEKLDYYRNKITGKKRKAKERWNRFSGTSGSGGRGL